jgi:hypothetical protein
MNETKTDMSTAVVVGRFVWVATLIGPGMHPDTSGADYESLPDELTPKMVDDAIAGVDALGLDASELLNKVFEPWLRHNFPETDERTWTVVITGPEEDDGESPYVYVVNAKDEDEAEAVAERAWRKDGLPHAEWRELSIETGVPTSGYFNDLR